jgi:tRNA threonylcarbamoyladenosine biosynthesis protein TsaE
VVVASQSEEETRRLAGAWGREWAVGDTVLLSGPLGAGKSTFVRGYLESLGHPGPVRSPTFALAQVFDTDPPVVHLDLYRVESPQGLDFFDLIEGRVALIEWPERLEGWIDKTSCWRVSFSFADAGRLVEIRRPNEL